MMLLIGESVVVLGATDESQVGLKGKVLLESSKTLLLDCGGRRVTIPKSGSIIQLQEGRAIIRCDEILGRLTDRITRASR